MPSKKFKLSQNAKKGLIIGLLVVVGVAVTAGILRNLAIEGGEAEGNTLVFRFQDPNGNNLSTASGNIYFSSITGLTQAEQGAKKFSDFTLLGTNKSGDGLSPDYTKYAYFIAVSCVGYNQVQFILYGTGTYTVTLYPIATNTSVIAFSSTLKTNLLDDNNNVTANSTETDWTVTIQCLNSTGGANNSLGFTPFCNFTNGNVKFEDFGLDTDLFLMEVQFNCTASEDWLSVSGISCNIEESGNSLFILVNQMLYGRQSVSLTFSSGMGTEYVIKSFKTGYGYSDGYTQLGAVA